jgi:hypothetical protein
MGKKTEMTALLLFYLYMSFSLRLAIQLAEQGKTQQVVRFRVQT